MREPRLVRELGCQVTLDVFANNAIMPNGLTVSAWETRVLGHLGDHRNIATALIRHVAVTTPS